MSPAVRWLRSSEDRRERPFDALALRVGAVPALQILALAAASPLVLVADAAAATILEQLRGSDREQGGLLVGHVHELPGIPLPARWLLSVEAAVPSLVGASSSISLRMEPELWRAAGPLLDSGMAVVGWYHSHPDLGAFFSGTDRATQQSFFRQPWSLGVVIDPVRRELATFVGPDADDYPATLRSWPSLAPFAADAALPPLRSA